MWVVTVICAHSLRIVAWHDARGTGSRTDLALIYGTEGWGWSPSEHARSAAHVLEGAAAGWAC
jgi:hypothetical protein